MPIAVTDEQAKAVLGALRQVATAAGREPLTAVDRRAIEALDRFALRRDPAAGLDALPDPRPAELAAVLPDAGARSHVA